MELLRQFPSSTLHANQHSLAIGHGDSPESIGGSNDLRLSFILQYLSSILNYTITGGHWSILSLSGNLDSLKMLRLACCRRVIDFA